LSICAAYTGWLEISANAGFIDKALGRIIAAYTGWLEIEKEAA
jgi:hypothetical protein